MKNISPVVFNQSISKDTWIGKQLDERKITQILLCTSFRCFNFIFNKFDVTLFFKWANLFRIKWLKFKFGRFLVRYHSMVQFWLYVDGHRKLGFSLFFLCFAWIRIVICSYKLSCIQLPWSSKPFILATFLTH